MDGLRGARVLIIDDVEEEILELARVLWGMGIPPLYVDPAHLEDGNLPKPVSGIRLAFLDMDILGAGTDPKSKIAALANCVRTVIDKNNGPYVAVAWTNHPELVKEFDDYIFPLVEIAKPSAFVTIGKQESKDLVALSARIDAELQNRSPVRMLQAWEAASVEAAAEVIAELAGLASGSETEAEKWREAWNQTMLRIMYSCGREFVGEEGMSGGAAAYKAFCNSLIPLHGDKLERQLSSPEPALEKITADLTNDAAKTDCGIGAKARINSMLHCSFDDLNTPGAGSVYVLSGSQLAPLFPDVNTMVSPLVPRGKITPEEFAKRVAEVASSIIPIAVEISPACDHVQGNLIVARLIGGYLAPVDMQPSIKNTLPQSIWKVAPLWLSPPGASASTYMLLVNSLLIASCALDTLRKEKALFRIRSQAFSNLQVSFATHAARPGMLLLRHG